jgi:hypothetical protein
MSEVTAFNEYYEHTRGCGKCRPSSSYLCEQGQPLHDAWWLAQLAEKGEEKRTDRQQQHQARERQRPPAPPRKVVRAGGRPRPPLEVVA